MNVSCVSLPATERQHILLLAYSELVIQKS